MCYFIHNKIKTYIPSYTTTYFNYTNLLSVRSSIIKNNFKDDFCGYIYKTCITMSESQISEMEDVFFRCEKLAEGKGLLPLTLRVSRSVAV